MNTFCMRPTAFSVSSDMSVPKPMLAAWKMMIDSTMADIYTVSTVYIICQFLLIAYRRA